MHENTSGASDQSGTHGKANTQDICIIAEMHLQYHPNTHIRTQTAQSASTHLQSTLPTPWAHAATGAGVPQLLLCTDRALYVHAHGLNASRTPGAPTPVHTCTVHTCTHTHLDDRGQDPLSELQA
eukprot:1160135-Pelagomonas_calceolata.AAC.13